MKGAVSCLRKISPVDRFGELRNLRWWIVILFHQLKWVFPLSGKTHCQELVSMEKSKSMNVNQPHQIVA